MANVSIYGNFAKHLVDKKIDYLNDTIKVMLCTSGYTPNKDTHSKKSNITNEVVGSGYTAGGATVGSKSANYDATNDRVPLGAGTVVWEGAEITARYAVIYDDTHVDKPLIGYIDFGEDKTSSGGGDFSITWDTGAIVNINT